MSDDQHNIFTEPPDELGEYEFHFGTFAVGAGGMNEFEVARAFGEAADRLLATGSSQDVPGLRAYSTAPSGLRPAPQISPAVMVVTMVMVSAYCCGPRTHTCPRRKGSFLAIIQYGGRERSISPPSDQKTRFAGFAVRTWLCGPAGRKPSHCGPVRDSGNAEGANLGAYPVCRFAPRPNENGQGRKLNAGAGLRLIRCLDCRNRPTSALRTV